MSSTGPSVDDNSKDGSNTAPTQVCSCDCQSRGDIHDTRTGSPLPQSSVFSFKLQKPTPEQRPSSDSNQTSPNTSVSTLRLPSGDFKLPEIQQSGASGDPISQNHDDSSMKGDQGGSEKANDSSSDDEDGLFIGCLNPKKPATSKPGSEGSSLTGSS